MVTTPKSEVWSWLRAIKPWDIIKFATAIAVVAFWILAVIATILYMVGYY